jgi:hypothetical protein
MGYTRTLGSAILAPEYCSNTFGVPSWSGVHESVFTPELKADLECFINFEAKLQGHNDMANDRLGKNASFFHVDFLSGWPQQLWQQMYKKGAEEFESPDGQVGKDLDWQEYLDELAADFSE